MKKILSALLALTMILSLAVMFATNVAAAASDENMWTVLTHENQYQDDYDGDYKSIPGYKYTSDGFQTYGGEWKADGPYQLVQTKNAVNIKDGVYMEVRVDEHYSTSGDQWLNFNIWEDTNLVPCSANPAWGEGVQAIMRISAPKEATETEPPVPGLAASVAWYIKEFTPGGSNTAIEEANRTTVEKDGKQLLTLALTITWDGTTFAVDINGSAAPEATITYMNETFADGNAYIGFSMYSSVKDQNQSCTILKFGTSKDTATTPKGTDAATAVNYDNTPVALMDASQVPAGQPGILMTGDRANSALKSTPDSGTGGSIITINGDYIHINALKSLADSGKLMVDNNISYAVEDFSILRVLTKNFCSCGMGTHADCMALESMSAYIMAGDVVAPESKHQYRELDICYDAYFIENGEDSDNYLTFTLDISETSETGRFNGVRLDMSGIDLKNYGFNEFDICFVGLFRTEEEADEYVEAYLESLGWLNPDYITEYETYYETIYEGEPFTVPAGVYRDIREYYLAFVPEQSGYYWCTTDSNAPRQTQITNKYGYIIATGNYYTETQSVVAYLNEGETYYIKTANIYGSNAYNIQIVSKPQNTRYEINAYAGMQHWVSIVNPGDYYDFVFTPDADGIYVASADYGVDIYMYDASNKVTVYSYSNFNSNNCKYFELKGGNTYYFRTKRQDLADMRGYTFKLTSLDDIKNPDVLMTGDKENSDLSKILPPESSVGTINVLADGHVRLNAKQSTAYFGEWVLDNSYNTANNPVIMCMTKNLCTCQMGSHVDCMALEVMDCHITIDGSIIEIRGMDICYDAYVVGDDNYLIFWVDLRDYGYSGDVSSIMMEVNGVDLRYAGFNEFEMCWIGAFETDAAATAFAENYLFEGEMNISYEYNKYDDFFTMDNDNYGEDVSDPTDPEDTTSSEETTAPEEETTAPEETTSEEEITTPEEETTAPEIELELEEIYGYINLGESMNVNINSGNKEYFFEFTPDKNGNYYFYSTGDCNVFGEILDEDGNLLAVGEYYDGGNFMVRYTFKKGKTYYLHTGGVDGEKGYYDIHLQKKMSAVSDDNVDKNEKEDETEKVANNAFGCSMSAGFGGVAIVAVAFASVGFASKRRRDEE